RLRLLQQRIDQRRGILLIGLLRRPASRAGRGGRRTRGGGRRLGVVALARLERKRWFAAVVDVERYVHLRRVVGRPVRLRSAVEVRASRRRRRGSLRRGERARTGCRRRDVWGRDRDVPG